MIERKKRLMEAKVANFSRMKKKGKIRRFLVSVFKTVEPLSTNLGISKGAQQYFGNTLASVKRERAKVRYLCALAFYCEDIVLNSTFLKKIIF